MTDDLQPGKPIEQPEDALAPITRDQLPDSYNEALKRANWPDLMPVQARTIPYVHSKRDMMIQSRTGSGKTGAFVLPMLEIIDPTEASCQALVMVPTRELAKQVASEAQLLLKDVGIRTVEVYGGVGYKAQLDGFRAGAHLVVGTPGRILDHLLRGNLSLEHLRLLVFDEADRMLSMGFYPDMREMQRYLPRHPIQGYMFSATYPPRVRSLAQQFLTKPGFLSLSSDNILVVETEHRYTIVPESDRDRALVRLIEIENPTSALIFCNTKDKVHYVATVLKRFGYDAAELSADVSQAEREKVMERAKQGTLRFLVATDVAERGIDIHELSHVIQFELPDDPETYVHRAGRTGRAGASGVVITLLTQLEMRQLKSLAKRFKVTMIEKPLPSEEQLREVVAERTTTLLEAKMRARDRLKVERMERFYPLVRALAGSDEELPLLAMLLDDYYQNEVHAPKVPYVDEPSSYKPGGGQGDKPKGHGRGRGKRRR
ncbi:DEAD/DEAH box helicase [bacterium]|nr:DEAD/DEAH box helicase [bacterium]